MDFKYLILDKVCDYSVPYSESGIVVGRYAITIDGYKPLLKCCRLERVENLELGLRQESFINSLLITYVQVIQYTVVPIALRFLPDWLSSSQAISTFRATRGITLARFITRSIDLPCGIHVLPLCSLTETFDI